ncbi:MAG TPA: hypothetical protein VKH15_16800 [Candidatus Acidoferrum sp.]|nr:hypothetical protein [Candidatus Acidoferrum sp.]
MRAFLATALGFLACPCTFAQTAGPVRADLSLAGGKTTYRIGEPIVLLLSFTASEPSYSLNGTTTDPPSPIDALTLSPTTGVFPVLDDQARGHRYSPDYASISDLEVNKPVVAGLTVNAVYRFDQPGHYKVHVTTNRVSSGDLLHSQPLGPLTTNEVEFDIETMSDADEAALAASLEKQIREANTLQQAQQFAGQLRWLTGDAATRTKLSLFLKQKTFAPFSLDASPGLWIARNRAFVVAELERALADPSQSLSSGFSLLQTAADLKARLIVPFDPSAPDKPLPTQQIEAEYLHQIAATLSQRAGESQVDAAVTVFTRLAQRKETNGADFAAAREVMITHFAQVNDFSVDWLLNSYGTYLEDPRIVPALEAILQTQKDPIMNGENAAALAQMIKIAPQNVRSFVIEEVCANRPTMQKSFQDAPFDSLPETDACLKEQIHAAAADPKHASVNLLQKTALAARFATNAIYDDLFSLFEKSGAAWDGQARGGMLAYLMRWDPQRARPLLEAALPLTAEQLEPNISFALFRGYYSAGLDTFLRERLAKAPPEQAGMAACEMSQYGPVEDQDILRNRLDLWRKQWSGKGVPMPEGKLEGELVQAVILGKEWKMADTPASALRESCISSPCRSRFQARQ